ncbi:AAA ATPase-like protein [Haloactinospora alba]|uniref:AAA ATPase-like protein n=1 Tax=Haloactinospora alba TaxID=405555 RepID=A0A543N8X5_9ACTN|nr:AAA family ATPase [Haloactinospora alba]TQN28281.1 AAA ATPase-like protein [Haloactinospora alba]
MMEHAPRRTLNGRREILDDLFREVDALRDGTGGCVVVEGDTGLGKTWLLGEVREHAVRQDVPVLSAAATELDHLMPMATLRGFPCAAHRFGRRGAEEDGLRVVESLRERISTLARDNPVVILLDDAQWADKITALAMRVLVSELRPAPVLWVFARRPGKSPGYAQRTLDWLVREEARLVSLDPLSDTETVGLLTTLVGSEPDRRLRELTARSGGNPFLVKELVRSLRDNGLVGIDNGVAVLGDAELSPELLPEAEQLLSGLSENTRWLLQAGSVLDRPFTVAEAAGLVGQPPIDILPALNEAVEAGALVEKGREFSFRHDLIRTALHNSLARGVRTTLQEAAEALSQQRGAEPGETRSPGAKAATGETAVALFREGERNRPTTPGAAADLILYMLRRMGAGDGHRPLVVSDAIRLLATAGRWEEAQQLAEEAMRDGASPEEGGEILLALADVSYLNGRVREMIATTGRALASPGISETTRGQLQGIRAHGLLDESSGPDGLGEAAVAAGQAVDSARRTGDTRSLVGGYAARSREALERGELGSAVLFGSVAARSADEAGDQDRHRHPRLWLAAALAATDRLEDAEEALVTDQADLEQFDTAWSQPVWYSHLAELRVAAGRLAEARIEAEMGARIAERLSTTPQTVRLLTLLARVALHRDEVAASRSYTEEAWSTAVEAGQRPSAELAWTAAMVAEAEGYPDHGAAVLARHLSSGHARVRLLARTPQAAPHIAGMALAAGEERLAEAVTGSARELRERNPEVPTVVAAALHAEGVLYTDTERLRSAAEVYRSGPRVLATAVAVEDLALAEEREGHGAAAAEHLRSALASYRSCDAGRGVRRVEERLGRLVVPQPESAAEPEWERADATGLTDSELRVARLVAEGLTNRDVANKLNLSPHTVDSHLRHSFTKLGMNSRVELTRWVLSNGGHPVSGLPDGDSSRGSDSANT